MFEALDILNEQFAETKSYLFDTDSQDRRGQVVLSRSFFENLLFRYLHSFLHPEADARRLFSEDHALATFSAKIKLCFALGLISPSERDSLNLIRRIANYFAHEFTAAFDDRKVAEWVASLRAFDPESFVSPTEPNRVQYQLRDYAKTLRGFDWYTFQCRMLAHTMQLRIDHISDSQIGGKFGPKPLWQTAPL